MMRRKIYPVLLVFCLSVLLFTTGCLQDFLPQLFGERKPDETRITGEREQNGQRETNGQQEIVEGKEIPAGVRRYQVYFMKEKNRYLLPVTVLQPWTEGIARSALEKLIKGPAPAAAMRFGISSPLPPQTAIRGINIRDGLCRVDFSRDFLDYDPGMEREVLGSVIHTLLQFNTVDEVEIVVEGSPVEIFPGGTPGKGTFDRHFSLNPEAAEGVDDLAAAQQLRLYFCTLLGEDRIFYVPLTRVVPDGEELLQATVRELLMGPQAGSGLFSEIPPGTEIKNLSLQGGIAMVDFSRELLNYQGGKSGEMNIKNQLLLTLSALPGVERVQVLVEGQALTLPYGTSFIAPLPPPVLINQLD